MLVPWTGEYVARVQNTTASLSEGRGEYYSDSGAEWLQYCAGEVLIVKGSDGIRPYWVASQADFN